MIETSVERDGAVKTERRCYVSARALTPSAFAAATCSHLGIESLHRVLDVAFKEYQPRLRRGHGAKNIALIRHLALDLIRAIPGNTSI